MKRQKGNGDNLTGGSKDVNPQWFSMVLSQTGADVPTTQAFPIPVQRLAQSSGKALVMEILKIQWDAPVFQPAGSNFFSFVGILNTKDPTLPTGPVPAVFFNRLRAEGWTIDYLNRQLVTGTTNDGTITVDEPIIHDLTDGAGHGILIATDSLYLSVISAIGTSAGTTVINNVMAKILYRWKEVALTEYIGIVQSQQ